MSSQLQVQICSLWKWHVHEFNASIRSRSRVHSHNSAVRCAVCAFHYYCFHKCSTRFDVPGTQNIQLGIGGSMLCSIWTIRTRAKACDAGKDGRCDSALPQRSSLCESTRVNDPMISLHMLKNNTVKILCLSLQPDLVCVGILGRRNSEFRSEGQRPSVLGYFPPCCHADSLGSGPGTCAHSYDSGT